MSAPEFCCTYPICAGGSQKHSLCPAPPVRDPLAHVGNCLALILF